MFKCKRKMAALLLAAMVAAGMLSGCSSGTGTSEPSEAGGSGETSTFDKIEEASVPEELGQEIMEFRDRELTEDVKDMGEKTFRLGAFDIRSYQAGSGLMYADLFAEAIASIEADYNCKIELVQMSPVTYMSDINTAKAAGNVYAHIYDTQTSYDSLYTGGVLADLQKVQSIGLDTNDWNPAFSLVTTYRGGVYGVSVDYTRMSRACLMFNKKLAEQYNLGDFYAMVENKEWTFDKFLEVSQSVYNQSNKQVCGTLPFRQFWMGLLVYANNTQPVVIQDGKAVFNADDNAFMNALNFIEEYSKQGLVNQDILAENDNEANCWTQSNAWMEGKSLFLLCDSYMPNNLYTAMSDDYGVLPLPIGPDADDYVNVLTACSYLSLADGDPDIEDSGRILVAIANRAKVKIEDYDDQQMVSLRDTESLDVLHMLMTKPVGFIQGGSELTGGLQDYHTKALVSIIKNQQTPKQALDAIATSVQAQLDRYYQN